ncbi:MAG: terminus macrodomain insulation protein YfbV [Enterovibrio sp.]
MAQQSIWQTLRFGDIYRKTWPQHKELAPLFPENRIIHATQFSMRAMPAVAVSSILIQIIFNNNDGLSQAVITALFALSLPLQGLWWLGKRSQTALTPGLTLWYQKLHQQLLDSKLQLPLRKNDPKYQELAQILTFAFQKLDKTQINELM